MRAPNIRSWSTISRRWQPRRPRSRASQIRDLARALQLLPEPQRQVVLLVGLEGMNYKSVAAVLEIPVGTVMSRLHRGRESLRRLMAYGPPATAAAQDNRRQM